MVYVFGNHEFYRESFPGLIDRVRDETAGSTVHFLENESLEMGGFRFFGCVLWSDMNLFGDPATAMPVHEICFCMVKFENPGGMFDNR